MSIDYANIFKEAKSVNDVSKKLFGYNNKSTHDKIKKIISEYEIDTSHFTQVGGYASKYEKITKVCPICENSFITLKGHKDEKTTCSRACSNRYFQHGENNPNYDDSKAKEKYDKVSKTLNEYFKTKSDKEGLEYNKEPNLPRQYKHICIFCKEEYYSKKKQQKFCSPKCQHTSPKTEENINKIKKAVQERITNGKHSGWQSRNITSYPEKFFMEVLQNNNISYIHNYKIKQADLGLNNSYNYFIDFYLRKTNICLEIDGKQHLERKEHDQIRDEYLTKAGYKVYRIPWKSINTISGKEYIKEEISNFLNYYNENSSD